MNASNTKIKNVDEHIASCPTEVQSVLKKLRTIIKKATPKADERISYGMPFYDYGGKSYLGRFIYFSAFKKHISLFITRRLGETMPSELPEYHVSKATYQIPINKPFPFALIETTVRTLVKVRDSQIETGNISKDILSCHAQQNTSDKKMYDLLFKEINNELQKAENKVWHGHPVWFLGQ